LSELEKYLREYKEVTDQQTRAIESGDIDFLAKLVDKKALIIKKIKEEKEKNDQDIENHIKTTVEEIRALEKKNIEKMEEKKAKVKKTGREINERKKNFDIYKKHL
jgi:hypothetical protein